MKHENRYIQKHPFSTIQGCVSALENREATSTEICHFLIQRSQEMDGDIRGFLHLDAEQILKDAELSDKRRKTGNTRSRYDGIPLAIKDNISVHGQSCGCASQILKTYRATYDATVISRLKSVGMI